MMPVIGGTDGVKVSTGMESAIASRRRLRQGQSSPSISYGGWYSDLGTETSAKLGEMLTKQITPDQFIEASQKMADKVKADPEVTKFKRDS